MAKWKFVEERMQKRLSSSKGKLLSHEDRLVLIISLQTHMVLYMISFLPLLKGVLQRLDYYQSRFFWQGDDKKISIDHGMQIKDQVGLGIHGLQVKNTTLVVKWMFKLLTEDGVWQTLLKRKIWLEGNITGFLEAL
jgi:hypothetical protein